MSEKIVVFGEFAFLKRLLLHEHRDASRLIAALPDPRMNRSALTIALGTKDARVDREFLEPRSDPGNDAPWWPGGVR
jgi:hypothetical protein